MSDLALHYGPWLVTVGRRTWPFPLMLECDICRARYYHDSVRYFLIRRWGEPGICPRCGHEALFGQRASRSLDEIGVTNALAALRKLADISGVIPPQDFRTAFSTEGFSRAKRAELVAALICAPDASTIKQALHVKQWIEVLRACGLVNDGWRPSRGVLCTANDGHPCRSLGERSIDDWMHRHGIDHEIEPKWPAHPLHNPLGKLRGDWLLRDGTIVEYAGMDHEAYLAKIQQKRLLAQSTNTRLIVVLPEDLTRLDAVFGTKS